MKLLCRYSLMFFLLFFAACTEKIDWSLDYQPVDLMVVEAKITNEIKQHEVKLSWPVYEMNQEPEPVSGATVHIFDGRDLHPLREDPTRPGIYLTAPDFAGAVPRGYQLRIRYGGKIITGVAWMRPVTDFPDMRLVKVQAQPPLYEVIVRDQRGPSVIRMELDWSRVPGYDTLPDAENHALIYHYNLQSIDVNRIFAPERERVQFPPGTVVIREKESVTQEYEEYLRGMLSETDWRGGVFDVLPGNARTNLEGDAIGYFTAAAVIRDTFVIP